MRASQSRQKSYRDKRRKTLKLQKDDHMFLRVTGVGRVLKSQKLTSHFIVEDIYLDPLHVIQMDDVQMKDNLTVEILPVQIWDREEKQLRGKEVSLRKVVWGGPASERMMWEREDQIRES
ncbi:uncharacterized protein LOC131629081 [Vicia villosa]|uniref:uncharacterized protein LOC131629081 n=1 Tax=Vicia villosa TaxID=3911 RepID=UPI00273CB54D|nr:uncharacterized protein LOC131629081 [Vicia villosa]